MCLVQADNQITRGLAGSSGQAQMARSSNSKQWLKDYPRLGFEILATKKIRLNNQVGFLLDLISRDNHIQLRQVLFLKGRHAVNITCRDHQDQFDQSLRQCNDIIRTFTW